MVDLVCALNDQAKNLITEATRRGVSIATAESLTAGMVSSALASVPGASAVLRGGVVSYCDMAKHEVLHVRARTLNLHTAVSSQTACEMANNARVLFSCDVAVSLTGYAGPDGGTAEDPAGTVYIATCAGTTISSSCFHFEGERNEVRLKATIQALDLLLARVKDLESSC